MADEKRVIHAGRDYFEKVEGDVYTGASGQAQQQINAQQFAEGITPESSKEDIARLLGMVKDSLTALDLPEKTKKRVKHEIEGAEIEVAGEEPDKPHMAEKLNNATKALKEAGTLGAQAVAIGNMIGKAILWCGEQWMQWGM